MMCESEEGRLEPGSEQAVARRDTLETPVDPQSRVPTRTIPVVSVTREIERPRAKPPLLDANEALAVRPMDGPVGRLSALRRDTLERAVDAVAGLPTRMIPAVTVTRESERPRAVPASDALETAPFESATGRRRRVLGATGVLAVVGTLAALWWPSEPPSPPPPRMRVVRAPPPPAPPLHTAAPAAPLEEAVIDPSLHFVDTLALHVPDVELDPGHRYRVSVDRLPAGAVVAVRVDDEQKGLGVLQGVVPGRALSMFGARALRLHCEPPQAFTEATRLDVQLLDSTAQTVQTVSLSPATDCLDLDAGRVVRLSARRRLGLPAEAGSQARVAWRWRDATGAYQSGFLTAGASVPLSPGLVQVAVVSHSVRDRAVLRYELLPESAGREGRRTQAAAARASHASQTAPVPKPAPSLPTVWPSYTERP
jgi:hypothetical protein